MQLHLQTWTEVEEYLTQSDGIILPIGSTEQHGPTGLIGTDAICAEAIAKGVGEETGALVGPTINVGMALHHLAFPGSMSLRPGTLMLVIRDYLVGLTRAGFRHFFFINGHGGNMATVKAAFSETYAHLSDLNIEGSVDVKCRLNNWFMGRRVYELAKDLYGDKEGSHATPSEVALTQFIYPEAIKSGSLNNPGKSSRIYGAENFRQAHPDGRMGSDPSLATPEHGERFYKIAVEDISKAYRSFLEE